MYFLIFLTSIEMIDNSCRRSLGEAPQNFNPHKTLLSLTTWREEEATLRAHLSLEDLEGFRFFEGLIYCDSTWLHRSLGWASGDLWVDVGSASDRFAARQNRTFQNWLNLNFSKNMLSWTLLIVFLFYFCSICSSCLNLDSNALMGPWPDWPRTLAICCPCLLGCYIGYRLRKAALNAQSQSQSAQWDCGGRHPRPLRSIRTELLGKSRCMSAR